MLLEDLTCPDNTDPNFGVDIDAGDPGISRYRSRNVSANSVSIGLNAFPMINAAIKLMKGKLITTELGHHRSCSLGLLAQQSPHVGEDPVPSLD